MSITCNLSEGVWEEGWTKGMAEGRAEGKAEALKSLMDTMELSLDPSYGGIGSSHYR